MKIDQIKPIVRINVIRLILFFKQIDPAKNIMLFCDPRGGSTFLMEIFETIPNSSIIWEPLHVTRGLIPLDLQLGWQPYIPKSEEWEELYELFYKILSGRKINDWSTRESRPIDFLFTRRFIVKFVRANAMIPWIMKNFKFKHKPIYFLRHPISTALSQIKAFYYDIPFKKFVVPIQVFNDFYKDHIDFLYSLKTKLEQQVAMWCIHNARTINACQNDKSLFLLYYEKLLMDPERELKKLEQETGINLPEKAFLKIGKPSKTDFQNDFCTNPKEQINKWQKRLNENELKKIETILKYFEISIYSAYNAMPTLSVD